MARKMAFPTTDKEADGESGSHNISSASNGGAVPRRSPADRRQARARVRRRLDSLNLDSGRGDTSSVLDYVLEWVPAARGASSFRTDSSATTMRDVEAEGRELYLHFFHERLRSEGLDGADADADIAELEEDALSSFHDATLHLDGSADQEDGHRRRRRRRRESMNLRNFQDPLWRRAGRDLQILADQFSHSRERELVRQRARTVDVAGIDAQKFTLLLKELFPGGEVTQERILVLFFFCSDVAILAIRSGLGRSALARLTAWTLAFLRERVCAWVHGAGGWRTVLQTGLNVAQQLAVIGMCAAVIAACAFYIRRASALSHHR